MLFCSSNAALGLGDSNDRVYPELVVFPRRDDELDLERRSLPARFLPVQVEHVVMSKLHTGPSHVFYIYLLMASCF